MPFLNLRDKRRCLYCFCSFRLRDCAVISTSNANGFSRVHRVLKAAPAGFARQVAAVYIPDLREFANELPAWACPHCEQPQPATIVDTPTYVLGVVGGRAAGKSHYIGTLVQMLLNGPQLSPFGISEVLAATGVVASHYDQEYYQPFFAERVQLTPTEPVSDDRRPTPLIYTITFAPSAEGFPRRLNLVILDYAGEDFTNEQSLVSNLRFLPYADGLILLVDPLTMPGTRQRLPLHMQQEFATGAPASIVLENVIRSLRRANPSGGDGLLAVPLVLTVAKADLLRYALPNLGRHPLRQQANDDEGFSLDKFIERSAQVRVICQEFDGPRLDSLAQAFRTHTYSMVSATGRSIDRRGYYGRPEQAVQPQRCLDPLLWLLKQHQVTIAK